MLLKHTLLVLLLATLAVASLVLFGFSTVSAQGPTSPDCPSNGSMMGNHTGMMAQSGHSMSSEECTQMGNMMGGMMNGQSGMSGMMGMMGGQSHNMTGSGDAAQFGPGTGMMGTWTPPAELNPTADRPLTLDNATKIGKAFIAAWKNDAELKLGNITQFSNYFYAQATETDTERAAFEFLIHPQTGTVFGEPGPNMMWNLRYGMVMGRLQNADSTLTLTVTPDKAREYAQVFLDKNLPSATIGDKLTTFYGYYTLDILKEGKLTGLLSVNGFTGQVWNHHWLGDIVTKSE